MGKKNSAAKVTLCSFDDLFGTEGDFENKAATVMEAKEIPLQELHKFRDHPFRAQGKEKLEELAGSVAEHGVLLPGICRVRPQGGYEILAGHTRKRACEMAGLATMPMLICDLNDDEATIVMVDSNIQREALLPSERARAYKMRYDAMNDMGVSITVEQSAKIKTLSQKSALEEKVVRRILSPKAIRTMNELDGKHGIGLIEKIRRDLGKPDIIYVKNFIGVQVFEKKDDEKKEEPADSHGHTEVAKVDFKKSQTETSRGSENGLSEAVKMDFRKSNVGTSRSSKNRHLEVSKATPNDTDLNDTDWSHTNHSHTEKNKKENHPINPSKMRYEPLSEQKGLGEMGEVITYLKNKMEYDMLVAQFPYSQQNLDELLVIMAEAILSTAKSIRIGETDVPQKLVRSRFEQYDYGIMEYVLESLKANTTKIHKIKAYLLTTLYNAPLTINNYYSAEIQHDMRGGR